MSERVAHGMLLGDRYHLLDEVGAGGMAIVWRADCRSMGPFERHVAVKVMKKAFSANKDHLDMFLEEARIGAELQHPNLVEVLDFLQTEGGQYCLVMEWIEGLDLRSLCKLLGGIDRPLPWALVGHIGAGVLRGLAAAHERRLPNGSSVPIIHRDVSPQNVLLGLNGAVKLGDFGIARARDRAAAMTAPGFVKGTLSYMAPEILAAQAPTPLSDQFALGCTLWESLAGERLFQARTDAEVFLMIRGGKVRPLEERRPDVPIRLVGAIHTALAMDPAARFSSAREFLQELEDVLDAHGPPVDVETLVGRAVVQAREARASVALSP